MSKSKLYIKLINSKQWRVTRHEALEREPMCEVCKANGRYRAAQCVHHIIPVESAYSDDQAERLCYDMSNLQSLCFKCHSEIHKSERYNSKEKHKERQSQKVQQWLKALNINTGV